MPEKCKDCCSRLFCMSAAEVNGEDFETMANKKDCRKRAFTNADRIRAMSDEELANIMAGTPICKERYMDCIKDGLDCEPCLLEWLKQPAE